MSGRNFKTMRIGNDRNFKTLRVVLGTALVLALLSHAGAGAAASKKIRVASKPFTESYLLAEMVAQLVDATGEAAAERRFGLGGPPLVLRALEDGEIDVDVNYTGALAHLFVKGNKDAGIADIRAALAPRGITLSESLGFNNTYAVAVRTESARALHLATISDLRGHPELRGAFTPDFLNYDDGFYKLAAVYGVKLAAVRPMQHALAYPALTSREIDLTDAYTTDGTLPQFALTLLKDDREFFPKYFGVIAIRSQVAARFPRTWAALRGLEGRFTDAEMTRLNARVDSKAASVEETARAFLTESGLLSPGTGGAAPALSAGTRALLDRGLWVSTREHFVLVMAALILSCLLGIPLGILAFDHPRAGQGIVAVTGLLQTIPSLALLCFLIPFLGIGTLPTVCALFIYGLLPVVQSTAAGLAALDARLIETAKILGLSRMQRLRLIELPLASITILAGIKTTAVISVATATIAALIGAGGYGRYITAGLAMNDVTTILKGAVPTALMAVGFHGLFELLSRFVVPRGLRKG